MITPEVLTTSEIVTLAPILGMAFTAAIRKIIRGRDNGDVLGDEGTTECAHINHDRSLPTYNSPENGRQMTRRNHYIDHFNRHGSANLGLSEEGNKWALLAIWERLTDEEKRGLPPPYLVGQTSVNIDL